MTANQSEMPGEIPSLNQGAQSATYQGQYIGQSDPSATHYESMYNGECETEVVRVGLRGVSICELKVSWVQTETRSEWESLWSQGHPGCEGVA